jgi:hypothetical protein
MLGYGTPEASEVLKLEIKANGQFILIPVPICKPELIYSFSKEYDEIQKTLKDGDSNDNQGGA